MGVQKDWMSILKVCLSLSVRAYHGASGGEIGVDVSKIGVDVSKIGVDVSKIGWTSPK